MLYNAPLVAHSPEHTQASTHFLTQKYEVHLPVLNLICISFLNLFFQLCLLLEHWYRIRKINVFERKVRKLFPTTQNVRVLFVPVLLNHCNLHFFGFGAVGWTNDLYQEIIL